jgi:hypothetical protein
VPERPILILPKPIRIDTPKSNHGIKDLNKPSKSRQISKHGPVFNRLRSLLADPTRGIDLREDPTALSPERVVVFEIAGSIRDFKKIINNITGFEFMNESEIEFEPNEDFSLKETRKGKEDLPRMDKNVPGMIYAAVPDVQAMKQLLSLWDKWSRDEQLDKGFGEIGKLFEQLHELRPWGLNDRISREAIDFWRDEISRRPTEILRIEVEFWFRNSVDLRKTAYSNLNDVIQNIGGSKIIHESIIADISYHGALIEIRSSQINDLINNKSVKFALLEDIMLIRPQSVFSNPFEIEPIEEKIDEEVEPASSIEKNPIAGLLDGYPLQNHNLLAGRIVVDDHDDLEEKAIVAKRIHGTAMASLIIHGDINEAGDPIRRKLYIRPIMFAEHGSSQRETSDVNRLLIDTIYRSVVEMKGTNAQAGSAPSVFIVNLSVCDERRPFIGIVSPIARLLDFLSFKYNILFFVSGGNTNGLLEISDFHTWSDFVNASLQDREIAVVTAMNNKKYERSLLSPAEAINVITIGSRHHDCVMDRRQDQLSVDPMDDQFLPNITSALGLGYKRSIKPDILMPGGREHVVLNRSGDRLEVKVRQNQSLYGLKAGVTDPSGRARLDQTALISGTSSATAMATRFAHILFDILSDRSTDSPLADMDPIYNAVVIKTLLIHGSKWMGKTQLLSTICGPNDAKRHEERRENVSRFIGYGAFDLNKVSECAQNRATLIGYGTVDKINAQEYRIPLPECLAGCKVNRSLTVTVAWFSPIDPGRERYRRVKLEANPLKPFETLGVERTKEHPSKNAIERGTVVHSRYDGNSAVAFEEDHIILQISFRGDDLPKKNDPIRYGIAVTIEAETILPIYDEISQRLKIAAKAK